METDFNFQTLEAAEVCFAQVSRLLYVEPQVAEVAAQIVGRQFSEAPFGMDDPYVKKGLGLMDAWCARFTGEDCLGPSVEVVPLSDDPAFVEEVGSLRREWFRLFVGVGVPQASCLESAYVEPNGHAFAASTLEVRAAYRRHGLQIERLRSEPDDHLGLMLGFVSRLLSEELDARESGDGEAAASLASEEDRFLSEHVLPWLAAWRYEVEEHADSDYLNGLGLLVFGMCEKYAQRFGIRFDEDRQAFMRVSQPSMGQGR